MRKILILLFFPFAVAAQTAAPVVTAFSSLHIPGSARGCRWVMQALLRRQRTSNYITMQPRQRSPKTFTRLV